MRIRLFRYTVGSAVAFGVSEACFVALFAPHLLGAKGSSVVASIVGVIPGYFLNRNWTWGRRGRSHLWREVAPYWGTVAASTVLAAVGTGSVNEAVAGLSRNVRTVVDAAAYCAVNGALFVAKFVLFNTRLFGDRRHAERFSHAR